MWNGFWIKVFLALLLLQSIALNYNTCSYFMDHYIIN